MTKKILRFLSVMFWLVTIGVLVGCTKGTATNVYRQPLVKVEDVSLEQLKIYPVRSVIVQEEELTGALKRAEEIRAYLTQPDAELRTKFSLIEKQLRQEFQKKHTTLPLNP